MLVFNTNSMACGNQLVHMSACEIRQSILNDYENTDIDGIFNRYVEPGSYCSDIYSVNDFYDYFVHDNSDEPDYDYDCLIDLANDCFVRKLITDFPTGRFDDIIANNWFN